MYFCIHVDYDIIAAVGHCVDTSGGRDLTIHRVKLDGNCAWVRTCPSVRKTLSFIVAALGSASFTRAREETTFAEHWASLLLDDGLLVKLVLLGSKLTLLHIYPEFPRNAQNLPSPNLGSPFLCSQ